MWCDTKLNFINGSGLRQLRRLDIVIATSARISLLLALNSKHILTLLSSIATT